VQSGSFAESSSSGFRRAAGEPTRGRRQLCVPGGGGPLSNTIKSIKSITFRRVTPPPTFARGFAAHENPPDPPPASPPPPRTVAVSNIHLIPEQAAGQSAAAAAPPPPTAPQLLLQTSTSPARHGLFFSCAPPGNTL